jgi:alpha-tubulin suppressor-like RCC1 family protein
MTSPHRISAALVLLALTSTGCGDGGAPTPPPPDDTPKALQIVSGNDQRAATGRPLASPLRVRVIGSDDQALPGATVHWSVTQGQATLNPAQSSTDVSGDAETHVTLGGTPGTIGVSAAVGDLAPVAFSIAALNPVAFTSISAGFDHTCGVTAAGDAYCWGTNELGQLGDGSTTDQVNPVLVSGGLSFTAVSAGLQYTCGVTAGGAAYCWGRNGIGQLGDGTTSDHDAPAPVSGGLSFTTVVAGTVHTCGVTTVGAAYCWGSNGFGEVGDGSTSHRLAPVPVAGGVSFVGVGVGSLHSCGLTGAGSAYCWGSNFSGLLGDGTTTDRLSPVPVAGGVSFASLAVSFSHTCAATAAGAGYCWGWNREGELGVGTATGPETCVFPLPLGEEGSTDCSTVPRSVAGDLSFTSLSRGTHNLQTCGVTAAGAAYCWGYNVNGELGTGTTTGPESCDQVNSPDVACSTAPVPVAGGAIFAQTSAGQAHTCGVTAAGVAYCWGFNGNGQLGDGTTTNRLTPTRVALE